MGHSGAKRNTTAATAQLTPVAQCITNNSRLAHHFTGLPLIKVTATAAQSG